MATSQKGGYDYEFVETPPEYLECSICLLTLRDPHVSSCCGNHFCQPCISRVQAANRLCPLCNESEFTTLLHKGVLRTINSLTVFCKWRRLGCDWKGEIRNLGEHLVPRDGGTGGCGLVMVDCSYKCGVMVERRELAEHERDECAKRPVEAQMSSLTNKLEKRLTIVEKKLESTLREQKDMKDKLSSLEVQNENLAEENKALKTQLKAIQHIHSHSTDTPPFYYTLYNFNYHKAANLVIFSPPFYSHPGGYKLRLQLYPNGTKHAKNKSVSLFAAIMLGEYDSDLSWPFNGRVSVEIFNITHDVWDKKTDFNLGLTASPRCVIRPIDCVANDGTGTITWISHDDIRNHYMIPGYDFVRLRVNEVQRFN